MTELKNKSAIVTGASRGIGASTARELAKQGVSVVLAARSEEEINALASEINDSGGNAVAVVCDVTEFNDLQATVDRCLEKFGRLDVMVNNAGVIDPIARLSDSDPAAWSQAADINYKGVYFGIRAVLPSMLAAGGGTIITVSSGAAHGPMEGWSHYCGAKAGAAMLTRCVHKEMADQGIRSFGLSPGTVATEMQVKIKASGINPVSQLDPDVHIDPVWPAKAIAWLCTDAANEYLGEEVSLKEQSMREQIGLG